MFIEVAALAASAAVGFGVGRVRNASKLAAVKAELAKVEGSVSAEVKKLVADVKSHL